MIRDAGESSGAAADEVRGSGGSPGGLSAPARLSRAWERARFDADLGSGAVGRLGILAAHPVLALQRAVPALPVPAIPLWIRVRGRRRVFWVGDRSELFALGEVILGGEYAWAGERPPGVVLDLGANAGAATLDFATRFPAARIVAVEPDPSAFARLRRNVAGLPNVQALNLAVGGRSGRARFEPAAWSWGSHLAADQTAGDGVEVEILSFDDLLRRLDLPAVDLVKMDIEGAEYAMLDAAARLGDVGELVGELHRGHPDAPDDIDAWLEATARRAALSVARPWRGGRLILLRRDR